MLPEEVKQCLANRVWRRSAAIVSRHPDTICWTLFRYIWPLPQRQEARKVVSPWLKKSALFYQGEGAYRVLNGRAIYNQTLASHQAMKSLPGHTCHSNGGLLGRTAQSFRWSMSGAVSEQAIVAFVQPLNRFRTPSGIESAIGRPLSRPISHPNTGRSPQPPRSKPRRGLNRAIVALLDGRNRARVIAESLARVIAAIRIASVRWRSYLPPKHRN